MPRQKNTKSTMIYWLWDIRPETIAAGWPMGKPFYCGKTVNSPQERLRGHRKSALKYPRRETSKRILECGNFIRMDVTEIVPPEQDWRERERFGIYTLRLLWPGCSTNVSDGGDGIPGWIPSPEWREKMAAANRGKKLSPEHIEKMAASRRGRKHSPESRAKMSAALRGRKLSSEQIEKMIAIHRGRKHSLEHRAKVAAANRKRKHSPETIAKMRAAHLGKKLPKQSPEHIAKRFATRRAAAAPNHVPTSPTS